jgi:hypothetical protein
MVVFWVGGFLLYKLPLYQRLLAGPLAPLYSIEDRQLDVVVGNVIEVRTDTTFILQTIRNEKIHVYVGPSTKVPRISINEGQALLVSGKREGDNLYAQGILNLGRARK